METIQNKVAESGIEVVNLEDFLPAAPIVEIDLAQFLAGGFVLREKEFRKAVSEIDWSQYEGTHVGILCSSDAIVPTWAFMLLGTRLSGVALSSTSADTGSIRASLMNRAIQDFDWLVYDDKIVVLKGCGSGEVPASAYVQATNRLQEVARKIMYGEPCSSVPIWRRPKK